MADNCKSFKHLDIKGSVNLLVWGVSFNNWLLYKFIWEGVLGCLFWQKTIPP